MRGNLLLDLCLEPNGEVSPTVLAQALGIDLEDLATAAPDQARLRDLYSIISIVRPWTMTAAEAWSWCLRKRLDRFSGLTPAALLGAGRAAELKAFLEDEESFVELNVAPVDASGTSLDA